MQATLYLDDDQHYVRIQGPAASAARARARIKALLSAEAADEPGGTVGETAAPAADEPPPEAPLPCVAPAAPAAPRWADLDGVGSAPQPLHPVGCFDGSVTTSALPRSFDTVGHALPQPAAPPTALAPPTEPLGVAALASPPRPARTNGVGARVSGSCAWGGGGGGAGGSGGVGGEGSGGEEVLSKLLNEADGAAHAMMEIDIPRESVGKVIGSGGAVIRAIRESTQATIKLTKDESGAGVLAVTGTAVQLERVSARAF